MLVEEVKKLSKIEQLIWFVKERESIRIKKERGDPKPFSLNEILQSYRFCNIVRIEDKVSQWLLKNWYEPYFDHKNMLPAIVMARHFNKIETLETIGFPKRWDLEKIKKAARDLKASGKSIFSAAYMVRGNDSTDKVGSVMDFTVQPLVDTPCPIRSSMEATWKDLYKYHGMGSFMAGQIIADARWAIRGVWIDRNDWAPKGPGSEKGMNWLHDRNIKFNISQKQFLEELLELKEVYRKKLSKELFKRMEMIDIQNTLCEGWKHWKTMAGMGRPKQLYNGFGEDQ